MRDQVYKVMVGQNGTFWGKLEHVHGVMWNIWGKMEHILNFLKNCLILL